MTPEIKTRSRWPALFQQSMKPLFVLNRNRRIRFVNEAWEKLTKTTGDDAVGMACVRKGPTEPLYRAFAPPSEAVAGRVTTVRRAVPPHKAGPPWWDVTFIPLTTTDGAGYLGVIDIVTASPALPARSVPASLGVLRAKQAEAFPLDLFGDSTLEGQRLRAKLHHAAASSAPVWLSGEPGSGKSTAARILHHTGPRRDQPFVRLDCAGVQPYLIDGLLWGTGGLSASHRIGTLQLQQPESLPRDLQQKIADWILNAVDAPRMICTSLSMPSSLLIHQKIIDDFATSFAVIEITVPPLRERLSELPLMLNHLGVPPQEELLKVLTAYAWPGNLRQLRDVLVSARQAAGTEPVTAAHLHRYLREKSLLPSPTPAVKPPGLDELLERVEAKLIAHALAANRGNPTDAAATLGIPRARIVRRMAALGITINTTSPER